MENKLFIVRVRVSTASGAFVSESYLPVQAQSESQACCRAVIYYSDGQTADKNADSSLWEVYDWYRGFHFLADKWLCVTQTEMDFFLSLTQGLSVGKIVGQRKKPECGEVAR